VPTYQYACTVCDHRFDQVQAFSDPSLTVCPECSGKLRKLYGSVGVVFKGSGFYRNDSRSTTKTAETSTPTPAKPSETTSTPATKSESSTSTKSTTSSTPAAKAS
jgi:putative FmdB family regulatory protein